MATDLRRFIRDVADFPKPGIIFRDITPMLRASDAFRTAIEQLASPFYDAGVTQVAAIESRGFIFGSGVAGLLGTGFVPIRKPGKLPWTTRRHEYLLEYGSDALEIHDDALRPEDRVLVVDDVLATGGTANAACTLVRGFGAALVGVSVLVELNALHGRDKLHGIRLASVLQYD
jgi:adenine phosphoribosyltransferase